MASGSRESSPNPEKSGETSQDTSYVKVTKAIYEYIGDGQSNMSTEDALSAEDIKNMRDRGFAIIKFVRTALTYLPKLQESKQKSKPSPEPPILPPLHTQSAGQSEMEDSHSEYIQSDSGEDDMDTSSKIAESPLAAGSDSEAKTNESDDSQGDFLPKGSGKKAKDDSSRPPASTIPTRFPLPSPYARSHGSG